MEQQKYRSEVQDLTPIQQEKLFDAFKKFSWNKTIQDKKIAWEELEHLVPEFAGYSLPTLKQWMRSFAASGIFRPMEMDEQGFCFHGISDWGADREEKLPTRGMQIILDLFALAGCWNLLELLIYCIRRG